MSRLLPDPPLNAHRRLYSILILKRNSMCRSWTRSSGPFSPERETRCDLVVMSTGAPLIATATATDGTAGSHSISGASRGLDKSARDPRELIVSAVQSQSSNSRGRLACSRPFSQYIGLQILERLINTRWKTLPEDQRQGMSTASHLFASLTSARHQELCRSSQCRRCIR